ncbi:hypothetical protein QQG55_23855 [Brugia pahangi]
MVWPFNSTKPSLSSSLNSSHSETQSTLLPDLAVIESAYHLRNSYRHTYRWILPFSGNLLLTAGAVIGGLFRCARDLHASMVGAGIGY